MSDCNDDLHLFAAACAASAIRAAADKLCDQATLYHADTQFDHDSRNRRYHQGVLHGLAAATTTLRKVADGIEQEGEAA